jgi:hypothetical protein
MEDRHILIKLLITKILRLQNLKLKIVKLEKVCKTHPIKKRFIFIKTMEIKFKLIFDKLS